MKIAVSCCPTAPFIPLRTRPLRLRSSKRSEWRQVIEHHRQVCAPLRRGDCTLPIATVKGPPVLIPCHTHGTIRNASRWTTHLTDPQPARDGFASPDLARWITDPHDGHVPRSERSALGVGGALLRVELLTCRRRESCARNRSAADRGHLGAHRGPSRRVRIN